MNEHLGRFIINHALSIADNSTDNLHDNTYLFDMFIDLKFIDDFRFNTYIKLTNLVDLDTLVDDTYKDIDFDTLLGIIVNIIIDILPDNINEYLIEDIVNNLNMYLNSQLATIYTSENEENSVIIKDSFYIKFNTKILKSYISKNIF